MMKIRQWMWCLVLPVFFLSACRDSPDRLLKDAHDVLERTEAVLLDVKSGKMSPSEAAEELEGVNEEIAAFEGRYKQLIEEGKLDEKDPEWERDSNEVEEQADKVDELMEELRNAGKMTPKLEKALEEF